MKNIEWMAAAVVLSAVLGCVVILPPPPAPPVALESCGRPYGEPHQPLRDLGACR